MTPRLGRHASIKEQRTMTRSKRELRAWQRLSLLRTRGGAQRSWCETTAHSSVAGSKCSREICSAQDLTTIQPKKANWDLRRVRRTLMPHQRLSLISLCTGLGSQAGQAQGQDGLRDRSAHPWVTFGPRFLSKADLWRIVRAQANA